MSKSPIKHVSEDGSVVSYLLPNGVLHREDGPAFISPTTEEWLLNGEFHREGGPARISKDSKGKLIAEAWFVNGRSHREDGPAYTSWDKDGNVYLQEWCLNGVLHREDGPAIIRLRFPDLWFHNGLLTAEIPMSKWADREKARDAINKRLARVKKIGNRYVLYKGTTWNGRSPINQPKCGCPNIFDYKVGYIYTEPHVDHDFSRDCGAGINVCESIRDAKVYGSRVVKVLVKKSDVVYVSCNKWRVKEVEVVEVVANDKSGHVVYF